MFSNRDQSRNVLRKMSSAITWNDSGLGGCGCVRLVQHLFTCACVSDSKSILWHKQMITHDHWEAGADPGRTHQSPCQPCSGLAFILDNLAPTAPLSPLAVYGLRLQRNWWNKQVQWQQRWEETRSLEKTALGIFFIAVSHCYLTQNISNNPSG